MAPLLGVTAAASFILSISPTRGSENSTNVLLWVPDMHSREVASPGFSMLKFSAYPIVMAGGKFDESRSSQPTFHSDIALRYWDLSLHIRVDAFSLASTPPWLVQDPIRSW